MTCQMRVLLVMIATTVLMTTKADDTGRNVFSLDASPPRKSHSRVLPLNQLLIDKIIDQRGIVPAREQQATAIGQPAAHVFSKDHVVLRPAYHRQAFGQTLLATLRADHPLSARNQRAILRDNTPLEGQSAAEVGFGGGRAHRAFQRALKEQLFLDSETPLGNLFHGQAPPTKRAAPLQKQAPVVASSLHSDLSDLLKLYDGPSIDWHGRTPKEGTRTLPYELRPPMHTEHDAFALPSLIWSSENLLNAENVPFAIDEPGFTVSPVVPSDNDEVHSSSEALARMRLGRLLPLTLLDSAAAMDDDCTDAVSEKSQRQKPVDSSASVSSSGAIATTVPSISVSANQSTIVGHILTSLTSKPTSSPVTAAATPIKPLVGNSLEPIFFHATKYGALMAPSVENGAKGYSVGFRAATSGIEGDERKPKYSRKPEVPAKNNAKTDEALSYVLGEGLKGSSHVRNSLATLFAPPEAFKYDWSSQRFAAPSAALFGYAPMSLHGRASLALSPSVPAAISAASWPMTSENADVSAMPAAKSNAATSSGDYLPLGIPLDLTAMSVPPIPSVSENMAAGVSVATGGDGTATMPASVAAWSLGRSLHGAEQLQRTQAAPRNPWYPAGLQLQLGGFGGINYTLRTSNPAPRPTEKLGLTLPKLPRLPHLQK